MKAISSILALLLFLSVSGQQYYIRGELRDEKDNPLENANIILQSTGYLYHSGTNGYFGIISSRKTDSLIISMSGYLVQTIASDGEKYLIVKLKSLPANISALHRNRLASITKNLSKETQRSWFTGDETYASIIENRFINASQFPATSVTLNIDKASYSNIRRFINMETRVPPDAVRIEEMLNYFNNNYYEPSGDKDFQIRSVLTNCPWNTANQLLFLNLSSRKLKLDTLPPSNLVFLIDVSGSMDMPNRLPLLKSAFKLLVNNLRAKDTVSIVVYGGQTGVMLNAASGNEKEKISKTIDELVPSGSTPGESGIRTAYRQAILHFMKGGNNRIILATDGDFNVGLQKEEDLGDLISKYRQSGIYLTCLGVGMGNYKDSKIQTLARKGNGNFAYLDNYQEAEKVLLQEFTQTLYAVADNAFINISFDPAFVKQYRLIGFDNKVGALADSLSVMEGGEIGSGQSMIAAFEIVPAIGQGAFKEEDSGMIANLKLQYRSPDDSSVRNIYYACTSQVVPFSGLDSSYKFSSAVIMFGSLLRQSPFTKGVGWNDILSIATPSMQKNNYSQKEFIELLEQAKALYYRNRRKWRNKL